LVVLVRVPHKIPKEGKAYWSRRKRIRKERILGPGGKKQTTSLRSGVVRFEPQLTNNDNKGGVGEGKSNRGNKKAKGKSPARCYDQKLEKVTSRMTSNYPHGEEGASVQKGRD